MLVELKFLFSVIGLTETKIQEGKNCSLNINLNGYSFISQPSKMCSGGVGMYLRENIHYISRNDLNNNTNEYEVD
jgi:exonuclease III